MTALPDWNIATDAELVTAAAAGDRVAFAGIYDRYADRLHDFCVGMVRDRDTAADCVQDAFCTAAADLAKLREPDKLRPWLYAIARHAALRVIRERRREPAVDHLPDEASGDPGPDTLAARHELANLIAQAAGGLSDRDREVLELAYRHGLNGPDLAQALGVTNESAKKLVQRLRDTIERSLGALLVARRCRTAEVPCPQLAEILQGWDGQFTILMRKRIARHIDSCANCDEDRRRQVNPAALLGAVPTLIPAPVWLRQRTLDQVQLTSTSTALTGLQTAPHGSDAVPTQARPELADDVTETLPTTTIDQAEFDEVARGDDRRPFFTLRLALFAALLVGIPLIGLGLSITWLHLRSGPIAPVHVTRPMAPPTPTTPTIVLTPSPTPTSPAPQPIPSTPPPPPRATFSQPVPPPHQSAPQPPPQPTAVAPSSVTQPSTPIPLKPCRDGSRVPFGRKCPTPPQPSPSPPPSPPASPSPPPSPLPPSQSNPAPPSCPAGTHLASGSCVPNIA